MRTRRNHCQSSLHEMLQSFKGKTGYRNAAKSSLALQTWRHLKALSNISEFEELCIVHSLPWILFSLSLVSDCRLLFLTSSRCCSLSSLCFNISACSFKCTVSWLAHTHALQTKAVNLCFGLTSTFLLAFSGHCQTEVAHPYLQKTSFPPY